MFCVHRRKKRQLISVCEHAGTATLWVSSYPRAIGEDLSADGERMITLKEVEGGGAQGVIDNVPFNHRNFGFPEDKHREWSTAMAKHTGPAQEIRAKYCCSTLTCLGEMDMHPCAMKLANLVTFIKDSDSLTLQ